MIHVLIPLSTEQMASLVILAFASSWTPGPNNALLAASGVNFGLRRSMPHVWGVSLGFTLMVFLVGLFLAELFRQSLLLREGLRWGGAAVLLWVAWQIARSGGLPSTSGEARPFTFLQAAAFQWINAKAWVMAVAISAQYVGALNPWSSAAVVALVFLLAGATSSFAWAWAGQAMRRILATPARVQFFNMAMGALVALGVVWIVLD
ncbi:MAG: LysE family translocator [Pararhodobacter sp.]|nr:LysE family translocator [Pararhodobacter sp.]